MSAVDPVESGPATIAFGPLLRSLRHEAQLTMEELSHASGISERAIGDMERGTSRGPQRRTVQALAKALNLAPQQARALAEAAQAGRPRPAGTGGVCAFPRGTGDFTGRAAELELLRELAEGPAAAGTAGVATISGPAGTGKTTLVVHAAEYLGGRFPDGRLYVDLRGMDPVPLEPAVALARMLKALGVAERRIAGEENERAGQYRAVLRERRCLIVLDNAVGEAQVRPLLPAAGPGLTLITSRRSLAGLEGVRQIPLAPLPDDEAATLLAAIIGRQRAEADPRGLAEVVRLCGNLPLAVRIAGNRLQSRPGWDLGQLAGRLGDQERRLEALSAGDLAVAGAFQLSYRQLSLTARLLFRRLALAAAPDFGVPMAAVLAEVDLFEAEDALEELVELGLLQAPFAVAYRFHDLVRLYARARLSEQEPIEERRAARRRMESWLLETAVVAGRWFEPGFGAPPEGWSELVTLADADQAEAWLRGESEGWLAALRSAARGGEHARVVEVAESMHWFSDRWIHWGHWREVFELSSAAARALADPLLEAVHLNYLSWAYSITERRYPEAERAALAAFELAGKAGDARQAGWSLTYAAWAVRDSAGAGDLERAARHAARGAELLRQAGDAEGYPQAALTSADCLSRLRRAEESLAELTELVGVLRDPGYGGAPAIVAFSLGCALDVMGDNYATLGRHREASEHYRLALPQLKAHPITRAIGRTLRNLAAVLCRLGEVESVRRVLDEARALYEEAGQDDSVAAVLEDLADLESGGVVLLSRETLV
ncbi:helix-turn-helix domain-containing protein [Spongiactinospora sp. TRM90649]|uniref:helix-turn-helix domain-containing protein n=1 Tax=Spongiactinospora sp. TRM90649 TaxID=3031114 RepID=UPI0023F9C782|nr:helix-turn-helix domain-containing protein [Spongiactinospora sp. TRM90649]MDF5758046.1 helix-turn-helix domain-containing protein [Spongiactinospora sp. TRM90649]